MSINICIGYFAPVTELFDVKSLLIKNYLIRFIMKKNPVDIKNQLYQEARIIIFKRIMVK
jgi:hypothetical protein